MNARIATPLVVTAAAAVAAAFAGAAGAATLATAPLHGARQQVVPIAMSDPGCHWFKVGGKLEKKLVVDGPTAFRNLDEKTLVFAGKGSSKHLAVGQTLSVSAPGVYHVTMVGQAPDDNHLLLIVK